MNDGAQKNKIKQNEEKKNTENITDEIYENE